MGYASELDETKRTTKVENSEDGGGSPLESASGFLPSFHHAPAPTFLFFLILKQYKLVSSIQTTSNTPYFRPIPFHLLRKKII